MPSNCARARFVLLAAMLALSARPLLAQESVAQEPEPEAAPAEDAAPKARPKPRPKPKPVAKPIPAATPAPTPAAAPAEAPAASHAALWPAGASTVSESYGDWTMSCARPNDKVACIVMQSQGDAQTGRRKFGFELQTPHDGRAQGVVIMPFGLALEPGVTFKLDEQALGKGAPYLACSTDGCIVSISFPTLALDGMRAAKNLYVTGQKPGGTEPATITVPLVGFPQAFDRAIALSS